MTENTNSETLENQYNSKPTFGFWVYLMTDCVLFASLFATYAVLHGNTFGGPTGKDLFNMPYVLAETLILLTSSFTCGMAIISAYKNNKNLALFWLGVTLALGLSFLTLELKEFRHLVLDGNSWKQSGFLSSFFTLVGTHGLHIFVGLLWLIFLIYQIAQRGFKEATVRRLIIFSLFWHFLDVVWIFIFTFVFMFGALKL